ncbi:Hsp70 family protein [Mycobacterium haemophilum]|uniref:Molecular chaperone n=1 Tax=Mycobacterium haemophilum TaxID=29311 RepID=A0A0I9UK27_9MYCO|nr:Hsp70 family protein [Mycobacterium haemophilum]KLO25405.1 molecular chaperone [Mycobacterium haemophilum]KLO34012.1 molecular chaperone [Mycobacterium haemophilum]KLO38325.1 molecular chaperone [Mycobacterium haemophilum]KLO43121.1 molecular chaperone [Mycobacterium haemophilum]
MSESLGLSIGAANLVAARVGNAPVSRRSVLTLFDHRPAEVGLPEENPSLTEPGLALRGFVERVGDRAPLVAADGTKYLGEAATVAALDALARTVGRGTPVAIAIPAYWSDGQFMALREALVAQPALASDGAPALMISDAKAALAALYAKPGFPTDGVVALCDVGASGASVTLVNVGSNAGSNFQQIGHTVRTAELSGDAIDQLILTWLRAGGPDANTTELASTARMGSLTSLLVECRRAKEELSAAAATTIRAGSLGPNTDIRLSRTEFEQLVAGPLDHFISTVEETLQRNGIPRGNLAAAATVGGGASIPLLTARLAERLQVPILTTSQPALSAAIGAAVLGQQQSLSGMPTTMVGGIDAPTDLVAPPTEMSPSAWAAQTAGDDKSATYRALAWSQEAANVAEPIPYTGPDVADEYGRETTGFGYPDDQRYAAETAPLPWYKRTVLIFGVGAAGAAVLAAVLLAVNVGHGKNKPAIPTTTEPAPPPPSQTVTMTGPNNSPTVTVIPPPPTTITSTSGPATTTSSQPATTTTTTPATTITTTTSQPATTTPTTSSPVTTTAPPPTTSQPTTSETPIRPTRREPLFEPPFRR